MKTIISLSLLLLLVSASRILQVYNQRGNSGNNRQDARLTISFRYTAPSAAQADTLNFAVSWNGAVIESWNANGVNRGKDPRRQTQNFKTTVVPQEGVNTLRVDSGPGLTILNPSISQNQCSFRRGSSGPRLLSEDDSSDDSKDSSDDSSDSNGKTSFQFSANTLVQVTIINGCLTSVTTFVQPPPPPPPSNLFTLTFNAVIADFAPILLPAPFQVEWNGQIYPQSLPTDFSATTITIPNLPANVGANTLAFAIAPATASVTSTVQVDNVVLSNGGANVVLNGGFNTNSDWTLTSNARIIANTGRTSKWPATQNMLELVSLANGKQSGTQTINLDANYLRV